MVPITKCPEKGSFFGVKVGSTSLSGTLLPLLQPNSRKKGYPYFKEATQEPRGLGMKLPGSLEHRRESLCQKQRR